MHSCNNRIPHVIKIPLISPHHPLLSPLPPSYLKRREYQINKELIIHLLIQIQPVDLLPLKSQNCVIHKRCVKHESKKGKSFLGRFIMSCPYEDVSLYVDIHREGNGQIRAVNFLGDFSCLDRAEEHLLAFENLDVGLAGASAHSFLLVFSFVLMEGCLDVGDAIHDETLEVEDTFYGHISALDIAKVRNVAFVAGQEDFFGGNVRYFADILKSFEGVIEAIIDV